MMFSISQELIRYLLIPFGEVSFQDFWKHYKLDCVYDFFSLDLLDIFYVNALPQVWQSATDLFFSFYVDRV